VRAGMVVPVLLVALLVLPPWSGGEALGVTYELRTWATTSAAPEGDPLCESESFLLRSRLGGPFVGHADSASFALWGCGAYTPVEGAFYATATDGGCVVLRWTLESLATLEGFLVYRGASPAGPFELLTEEILPAESPGVFEDCAVWPGFEFWYELRAVAWDGSEEPVGGESVSATTGGEFATKLHPASPNPFRGTTTMRLDLAGARTQVRLTIFAVSGKVVTTLVSEPLDAGRYEMSWDGTNDAGRPVASGVYFCRMDAGQFRESRSIVLVK